MALDALLGQSGHARRDLAVNGNISDSDFHCRRNQGPGLAGMPAQKTFALQRSEVLHHRGLAGEPEMALDFTSARRNAFLSLLALDEIENSPLPLGEHA